MKKYIIIFIALFLNLIFLKSIDAVPLKEKIEKLLPKVDHFIANYLKNTNSPGCVVAIVGPREVLFLKAYGVKKQGQSDSLTPETVFQLASLSKTVSATLAVKLFYQGKLSLDAPIRSYLPDFEIKGLQNSLSLKHILSHTSGFSSWGTNTLIEKCVGHKLLYDYAKNQKISHQPGEYFDYHNIMYGLIEDIIMSATKQSFEDLLQENLFKPLGMKYITLGYQAMETVKNRAYPHEILKKSKDVCASKKYSTCYYSILASAGMNGSMLDLIPFLQAQIGGRPDVLSASELKILHTSQIHSHETLQMLKKKFHYVSDAGYALGWRWMDYAEERIIYHGGWVKGFKSMIAFSPKHQVGIAVLHHTETLLSFRTIMRFFDLLLGVGSENKSLNERKVVKRT